VINKIRTIKAVWLMLIVFMVMPSCRITETYKRPAGIAENGLYRDVTPSDSNTIADIPWKQIFTDTLLQDLIQEGIDSNLDLKIAVARIKQAQANLKQSKSAYYPSLDAIGSASFYKNYNGGKSGELYQLYGSASWEIDIWGKLRSAKRAEVNALLQNEAYKRAVQTQLVADIATDYYTLMAFDAQLQLTLETVENRKESAATMKELMKSDVVTGAAVVQSEANLYSVKVTIPDLKRSIREMENSICILLARDPGGITRDSLYKQEIGVDLKTGFPAQLLANRPDVQEAEYKLRYYFELTNVARTYFYPSLTITAAGGWSSTNISQFFNASTLFGNIAGGLMQPVLNNGLNKQRLRVAQAQQEEYLAAFEQTLLNAGLEVSNALYFSEVASDKMGIRSQQLDFLQKSVEYTKALLLYSDNTNYTDVLTSEQNLLAAQLNAINDKFQQLQAIVALYRSLGGGWK
jgi:NodT family efflux transporter outer membrane factor (OMF) lipoprotein